jgi:hypothetical protein
VSDESTAVLQGQLERALSGDAEARQRLLELHASTQRVACLSDLQKRRELLSTAVFALPE